MHSKDKNRLLNGINFKIWSYIVMKFKVLSILLIFSGLIGVQWARAQQIKQPYNTIKDDIEIMETILDKLFRKESGEISFLGRGTKGYYLDGYGVLFDVPYSSKKIYHQYFNEEIEERQLKTLNKSLRKFKGILDQYKLDNKEQFDKELLKIKNIIARFMGDYASAINYLKPNYWITVVVDFSGSSKWLRSFYNENVFHRLVAKAQMKDITAYRRGNISLEILKQKIHYNSKFNGGSVIDEDIDIFSDIMRSFLEKKQKHLNYNLAEGVRGFYLDGYGAVFMLKADMEPNILKVITTANGKHNFSVQTFSSTDSSNDIKEKLDFLESRIINLLSRFGHTMRKLDDNEWLEIALNINAHDFDEDFSKMILKIKKRDINDLSNQKIDLDRFKQRIKVIKY